VNGNLLVATIGFGIGSQLSAARLLYAMSRSNAIPKSSELPKRGRAKSAGSPVRVRHLPAVVVEL